MEQQEQEGMDQREPIKMDEFRQKTINGIIWSVTSQVGQQALVLTIGIILARILSPREFGLIAMIVVISGFAIILLEFGFSNALIQKKDVKQIHLSSVFWLNLAIGFLLMVIFMLVSPLIARFYHEPLLIPITIIISINFLINSFSIIQSTLLKKALDFRTLTIVDISSVSIAGIVAIVMAFLGSGVWSLAVRTLLVSLVTFVLLWKLSSWRPDFVFSWQAVKALLGFSASWSGTRILDYWTRNIDNLLIGKFLGTNSLGIYSRAYWMMLFPFNNVSCVISRVMFPSFSIIQENKQRVKHLYLIITRVIALITFPLMLGLFATVEPFVITVFGQQWAGMIPILRVFSILGMIQSISTLNGNLYLSQGRADLQFKVGLVLKANQILGIIIGLHWGIIGVALGYAIASLINYYPNFFYAGRLVNLSFSELMKNLAGVFGCSVSMAVCIRIFRLLLPGVWAHWIRLIIFIIIGILIYIIFIHIFRLKAYMDMREFLLEQWHLRFAKALPNK